MRYQAVIFDLDGVLVSTDELHYAAWKEMADREGIYFEKVINNRLRGVSRMESLEIILERAQKAYTPSEKEAMASWKNNRYRELLDSITPADLLPGAMETLCGLKEMGIRIAVGSSSKNTPKILKQLDIASLFDAISDGNNITKSKPDPEVFLKAAEYLSLPAEACVVVEDAFSGIDAANAAGMLGIGIGDAASYAQAAYQIETLPEVLTIMQKENNNNG